MNKFKTSLLALFAITASGMCVAKSFDPATTREYRVIFSTSAESIYANMGQAFFLKCDKKSDVFEFRNVKGVPFKAEEIHSTNEIVMDTYKISLESSVKLVDCNELDSVQKAKVSVVAHYLENMDYKTNAEKIKWTPRIAKEKKTRTFNLPIDGTRVFFARIQDSDIYLSVKRY